MHCPLSGSFRNPVEQSEAEVVVDDVGISVGVVSVLVAVDGNWSVLGAVKVVVAMTGLNGSHR